MIHSRHVLGDAQRVAEREDLYGRADPHALSAGGDEAGQCDRRRVHRAAGIEVDLPEPDAVESRSLGLLGQVERFLEGGSLTGPRTSFLEEDPEMHGRDNALLGRHCQKERWPWQQTRLSPTE